MVEAMTDEKKRKVAAIARMAITGDPEYKYFDEAVREAGYGGDSAIVTRQQLRQGMDVSYATMALWVKEGMPVAIPSHGQIPSRHNVFEVAKWLVDRERKIARRAVKDVRAEADPLLSGENSPPLEKYREEKYREAKRKNDVEEGKLVYTDILDAYSQAMAATFRQKAEIALKNFEPAVADFLRETLDEAAGAIAELARRRAEGAGAGQEGAGPAPIQETPDVS